MSLLLELQPPDSWKKYGRLLDETKSLEQGRRIHQYLHSTGFRQHLILSNHLLNMYVNCGSLREAELLFTSMLRRNTFSWNTLIRGNGELRGFSDALLVFRSMLQEGIHPDTVVFLSLIKVVARPADARIVQSCVESCGFAGSMIVGAALIGMHGKCGSVEQARQAFQQMPEANVVSWNALITVYWRTKNCSESIFLLRKMLQEGIPPSRVSFVCAASVCAEMENLRIGNWIHDLASKSGFISCVSVANAVMNLYDKCNRFDLAKQVFDQMEQRDVTSWNTMIAAFAHNKRSQDAIRLYERMELQPDGLTFVNVLEACDGPEALNEGRNIHSCVRKHGLESDLIVATALVSMYRRCGSLREAAETFEKIQHPGVITCNSLIAAFAEYGLVAESLLHFRKMLLMGIRPSKFTFITVLSSCSTRASLREGRFTHKLINESLETATSSISSPASDDDILVENALISMYGKCGELEISQELFNRMLKGNVSSWNAIISVHAQHGFGDEAVEIFQRMQLLGVSPDAITHTGVLSACSHARLVEQGCELFYSIQHDYWKNPSVEHYGCVIDLLGRAGWLNEAEKFLREMPMGADSASWMALLGACRMYGDDQRGAKAAEMIVKLEPENAGTYTVLSNIYSAAGRWRDAEKMREAMVARGVKKQPGCSWIEIGDRIHEFVVKDRSHPRSDEIYEELERLSRRLKEEEGYVPVIGSVLHDVEDEHKEALLWHHSEKLALALGLLSGLTSIRIIKNLRICDDCHLVFKLAAKVSKTRIVVRDCYRFHHFENGLCSCRDCW